SQSTDAGTIAGTVTDATGAVVNGATVMLTDTSTRATRNVTTNDAGRYVLTSVDPGAYELSITKKGFSTTKTQAKVTVGASITLNLSLEVGGQNVVVEVTAAGSELQTDRKSTRLNSSHVKISYAVFCLKKKNPKLYNPRDH